MNSDSTELRQLTDPPRAGEWGNAVLPFGDYDPRISPDGSTVVYERMADDSSPHGNYDLFLVDIDGSNERRLTETGWTQGIASWSPSGENLIFLVSAKGLEGAYDMRALRSRWGHLLCRSMVWVGAKSLHDILHSIQERGQYW